MWQCDGCNRHVLRVAPVCPFCAGTRVAALGMAAVAPLVLSACYGMPPCDDNEMSDDDGDGYYVSNGYCSVPGYEDCDDTDPTVHPDAEEICGDEIDQNCDGVAPGPDVPESCNGIDDDCDDAIDEDLTCDTTGDTGGGYSAPTDVPGRKDGAVEIAIDWSAQMPVATCADAGVEFLDIGLFDPAGVKAEIDAPSLCDDQTIVIRNIPQGDWQILISADGASPARTWASDPVAVRVVHGEITPVTVQLGCSSDIADGCGGG
ncbi:MAG: putative metal-binding motif-containing protein [Myxococcota bacterium]